MRTIRPTLVLCIIALGCSAADNTGPAANSPAHGSENSLFPRAALSISVQIDRNREPTENDTVTLTAQVVDSAGVELFSPAVQWSGGSFVRTTARTASLRVSAGTNFVTAVASIRGVTIASASAIISARPLPGEMVLWNPATGAISRVSPPASVWRIEPASINDRGEVTGTLTYDGHVKRAFFWSRESGFVQIPSPLYGDVSPAAINNDGVVAGTIVSAPGESTNLFIWSQSSGFFYAPEGGAYASAINSLGRVVGYKDGAPFVWSASSGFELFQGAGNAPFAGQSGYTSSAVAISDDNAVLTSWTGKYARGTDYNWIWDSYPAVWIGRAKTDLACADCIVADMNNSHTVIGLRWNGLTPFRWTSTGGIEALPVDGTGRSEVVAINDSGLIVGAVTLGAAPFRAAAWLEKGLVVMPELPGTRTSSAADVNKAGIVLVGAW